MVVGLLNKIFICILILFFSIQNSYSIEFKGKFEQGSFIIGKTDPNSIVKIDKKNVKVSDQGYFVFGLGRDRKNDVVIQVFKDRKLEVYERIKRENKIIGDARSIDSDLTFFTKKFINPLDEAIVTGVYGSQRILNGKPRWPHYGVDFAAKEGTKIRAMLDGTATMVEPDLFYTGGTLIFDHGHGISTLYMHMKDIYVTKDQKVKQGDIIGTVGSTGRSTGPHLDVRLNWFNVRLDPSNVLDLN